MRSRFLAPVIHAAAQPAAAPSASQVREAQQQAALGLRLAQKGEHLRGIERLQRAARLDPTVATTQRDLGLAWAAMQRLEEAAAAFRRAVAIDPGLTDAHQSLAIVLSFLGRRGRGRKRL